MIFPLVTRRHQLLNFELLLQLMVVVKLLDEHLHA